MSFEILLPLHRANNLVPKFKPDNAYRKLNKQLLDFFVSPTKNIFIYNTFPKFGKTSYFVDCLPEWFKHHFPVRRFYTFTPYEHQVDGKRYTNYVLQALKSNWSDLIIMDDAFNGALNDHKRNKFGYAKKIYEWFENVAYPSLFTYGKLIYVHTPFYEKDPTYYIRKNFKSQLVEYNCPLYDKKGNYTTWKTFVVKDLVKELGQQMFDLMYLQKHHSTEVINVRSTKVDSSICSPVYA